MLSLIEERSLFQSAIDRVNGILPPERILVVTVADQADQLREQAPEVPAENFLLEPMPRGTASVVGLAALALQHRDPQAVMAVLTSDHYIGNQGRYQDLLRAAHQVALDGYLVTLGIAPTFPATGYGYIQQGEFLGTYLDQPVYRVLKFKEKPDDAQARLMLESGNHAWNSGMFVWQVSQILDEFTRQMPDLASKLAEIGRAWDTPDRQATLERLWPTIQPETIDYGVMEGAHQVAVIPAQELNWSDVGTWDSLFDVLPADLSGNIVMGGKHIAVDTRRSLVYVNQEHRLIVTIGVKDLVVVDTGDVLLVCHKSQAQKVRQVVNKLSKDGENYV